jgi:hypothetical protein
MNPTSGKKPKSPLKMKAPDFPSPGKKTSDAGEYVDISFKTNFQTYSTKQNDWCTGTVTVI